MHRSKEVKEFISPLLQPPLNRLFIPRPTPDYLSPIDRDQTERTFVQVEPTSKYLEFFQTSQSNQHLPEDESIIPSNNNLQETNHNDMQKQLESEISKWDPKNNSEATEDPFKTLFVGRLPYDVTEARLRREFSRYGPIKTIKIITNSKTGQSRGYAFIEFEKEKDMKVAYLEADALRFEGGNRRILVDIERGRTIKGWKPRRLGGGLGKTRQGGKDQNQKYSGRDPRANDFLEDLVKSGTHLSKKRSPSPRRDEREERHYSRSDDRRRSRG